MKFLLNYLVPCALQITTTLIKLLIEPFNGDHVESHIKDHSDINNE